MVEGLTQVVDRIDAEERRTFPWLLEYPALHLAPHRVGLWDQQLSDRLLRL